MQTSSERRFLIAVGKIAKPFGIRGDLVIYPMTDNPERFKNLKRVFVGHAEDSVTETHVTHVVVEPRGVRLRLSAFASRTAAESLTGALLFVDQQDAIKPKTGSYFIHDLIALKVVDTEGNDVGVLKEVMKYPAHDVYVIERNGTEIAIPAVKDFIKNIDLEQRTMTVQLIEGMLTEPESVHEEP
jgi:16S rRNA processing protein RimM